jgi:nucleolar complex protein 2
MVKTTKRARKFVAKGGAKGMLEKGTITKKGKLRVNSRKKSDPIAIAKAQAAEKRKSDNQRIENDRARVEEDFTSQSNLGDLDLDSFLKTVADDGEEENASGDEDDGAMEEDASDSEGEVVDFDSEDDEDIEAAEARMKAEMEKLAENDPDFHEYLQNNESSLLDFKNEIGGIEGEDDDDDDEDDDAMEGAGDDDDDDDDDEPKSNDVLVDAKTLKAMEYGAFESHGLKPLRKLIQAYVSACHMADAQDQDEDGSGRLRINNSKKYLIESSTVFDKLMVTCLSKVHEELHYHLLGKGSSVEGGDDMVDDEEEQDNAVALSTDEIDVNAPANPRKLVNSHRWTALKMSIQSFIKATLHLMAEAKEAKLLSFIIKSLANYVPYLSAFPRLGKALLKALTSKWASTSDASESYQTVRLNAFLRIRQLALTQPFPFIELCLKSTYLAYAKASKFANASTVSSLLPQLTFMGNCVVELYSLDYASSYQHAFVYIRQLALHLRSALQKKTPDTFRIVYCWQYMHCLKLWTAVLAASSGKTGDGDDEGALMRSLIYPLVEIIFGVAKLIPSTRHLPLRLHCVRYLQQLAAASEMFIPTTSILLEVFDLKEISMAPKRVKKRTGDVRGVRLPVILKLPKEDALRTVEQLDTCLGETFLLLNREVDLYKYSAGIPEFSVRICQTLRKVSYVSTSANQSFL